MLRVMKNNWNRLMEMKAYIFISMLLTIISVSAAIFLTTKAEVKGNIAVVISSEANQQQLKNDFSKVNTGFFHIEFMDKAPQLSKLVQGGYDAVITVKDKANYQITTLKSEDFKKALVNFMEHKSVKADSFGESRKVGTNILGYMLMFLLMQGILYARFFAEDKEKHMIKRVAMSPISFISYIAGHGAFVFLLTLLPSFAIVVAAKLIGMNVGFSLPMYFVLIGVAALLATTFALFLNSFFCDADTANMVGSSAIVLTSILAGSFYSFSKGDNLFDKFTNIFPQKYYMNFVNVLEKGNVTANNKLQFTYVLLLSVLFFLVAVLKTRSEYLGKKRLLFKSNDLNK